MLYSQEFFEETMINWEDNNEYNNRIKEIFKWLTIENE